MNLLRQGSDPYRGSVVILLLLLLRTSVPALHGGPCPICLPQVLLAAGQLMATVVTRGGGGGGGGVAGRAYRVGSLLGWVLTNIVRGS